MKQVFIGNKTLEELNFPKDWKYDFAICRWFSEKHTLNQLSLKKGERGKILGKEYVYITDEDLCKIT